MNTTEFIQNEEIGIPSRIRTTCACATYACATSAYASPECATSAYATPEPSIVFKEKEIREEENAKQNTMR